MAKRRAYYVLSTHWDREWYSSFQDFRYRLVRLMDRVLAGLEDGRLAGPFQTDGQALLVEDYLEIRPDRRELIRKLAAGGLLRIGPWYALPDEFTVSGESLVRNLRLGREVARSLGTEPTNTGFACDMFGHNSQLPQILAGFGIQTAFVWRGTNVIDHRQFIWRGADGTQTVCYRFGQIGYCTFTAQVRHTGEHQHQVNPEQMAKDLDAFLEAHARASDIDAMLMFDGGDHLEWDPQAYALMVQHLNRPDSPYQLIHGGLDEYAREMLEQKDRIRLVLEGELREPARHGADKDQQFLIPGVLSSRVNLKLANRRCETLLCHWAEPFCALAAASTGQEFAPGFLRTAWRWLIQNHPHDSMDGCSIDQVHKDMEYRFDQAGRIADRLATEATDVLAASIEGEVREGSLRVTVFNPLPRPFEQVAELTLQVPTHWPGFQEFFGFEAKPAFQLFGANGSEIPYQRVCQSANRVKYRPWDVKFPQGYHTHDVTVALPLSIPAMGYASLELRSAPKAAPIVRHPDRPGLATGEASMANEHLAVQINSNGSIDLTDCRTGQVYRGLMVFEDCADIGDGWYHGMAVNDQATVSTACGAEVALLADGPMQTSFRVRTTLRVPKEFDFSSMTRGREFVEMIIDNRLTLRRGQDYLEVRTTVDNVARDHRLRVLLPSGAAAKTYLADSQFDVVCRPIALRSDNHEYRELEVETKPQQSWTAVCDDSRGLAVVAGGLLETAVRDLPSRPIALTLLRATRRTVFTDGEPGGQLQGRHTFDYWIVPLTGQPDRTCLCEMGHRISAGLRTVQLRPDDVKAIRSQAVLPSEGSLLRLEGPAVLTSARNVGANLEVRLFNPQERPVQAHLSVGGSPAWRRRFTQYQYVDLESNPLGPPQAIVAAKLAIELGPKKIVTLSLS